MAAAGGMGCDTVAPVKFLVRLTAGATERFLEWSSTSDTPCSPPMTEQQLREYVAPRERAALQPLRCGRQGAVPRAAHQALRMPMNRYPWHGDPIGAAHDRLYGGRPTPAAWRPFLRRRLLEEFREKRAELQETRPVYVLRCSPDHARDLVVCGTPCILHAIDPAVLWVVRRRWLS